MASAIRGSCTRIGIQNIGSVIRVLFVEAVEVRHDCANNLKSSACFSNESVHTHEVVWKDFALPSDMLALLLDEVPPQSAGSFEFLDFNLVCIFQHSFRNLEFRGGYICFTITPIDFHLLCRSPEVFAIPVK